MWRASSLEPAGRQRRAHCVFLPTHTPGTSEGLLEPGAVVGQGIPWAGLPGSLCHAVASGSPWRPC